MCTVYVNFINYMQMASFHHTSVTIIFCHYKSKLYIVYLQLIKNDKVMFEAADRNRDGVLTRTEFIWFSHPEEFPEMLPFILQNTLDDKDTDKNGVIDFQEFLGERGTNIEIVTVISNVAVNI